MAGNRAGARKSAKGRAGKAERTRRISVFHANPIRSYHFDTTSNKAVSSTQDGRQNQDLATRANQNVVMPVRVQASTPQYNFVTFKPAARQLAHVPRPNDFVTPVNDQYKPSTPVSYRYDMANFQFPPSESVPDGDLIQHDHHHVVETITKTTSPSSRQYYCIRQITLAGIIDKNCTISRLLLFPTQCTHLTNKHSICTMKHTPV